MEKKVSQAKHIMSSYAFGDPMEHLHNELLEVPGKAKDLTDLIFYLCHFLDQIIKTHGKPP